MGFLSTVVTSIGFCPQNPEHGDKTGVTIAVTPVSCPFLPVIAASKQLPYEVCPDGDFLFLAAEEGFVLALDALGQGAGKRSPGSFSDTRPFKSFPMKIKKRKPPDGDFLFLAAEEGFEPSQTDPESVVLPLHNSAIRPTAFPQR